MWTCTICRFATELDDIVTRTGGDRCVCLRCFDRETEQSKPMPKALRRQLIAVMAEPGVAWARRYRVRALPRPTRGVRQ